MIKSFFFLDFDLIVGYTTYSSASSKAGRSGTAEFDAQTVTRQLFKSHGGVTMRSQSASQRLLLILKMGFVRILQFWARDRNRT